jgi:uncharacterized protein (TIGR02246 family)
MADNDLTLRVERLEAESAVRALAARYCFAIDNHDLAAVRDLFTEDARVYSRDGVMDATGRDAIIRQYEDRFRVLGPSNHVSHDHWVRIESPDRAVGTLSAHAELWRNDQMMVTALRYEDEYRRENGIWRFASRELSFLYYVPVAEYVRILGEEKRMRAYVEPAAADYPEPLPTWRDYR